MRIASSLLLVSLVGCAHASDGSAPSAPLHPNPEPTLARSGANDPGVACARGLRWDSAGGCVHGAPNGSVPIRVAHRHDMRSFRLVGAAFAIDGALLFDTNDPALLGRERFPVLSSALQPGEHEIGVTLVYAGTGEGVFSYLKGYRFEVRSRSRLTLARGRSVTVTVVGYERDGPTTPLEERPAVRLDTD
jgi:hypothetical protein